MTTTFTDLVQSQIDNLRQEIADAQEKRELAQQEIQRYTQVIDRSEAKIEVLCVTLDGARKLAADIGGKQCGHHEEPVENNGEIRKLKATEAIFSFIDKSGSASREELLSLDGTIDTTAANPRHIIQTTIYQLTNKGKLVEENGVIKRP